MRKTVTSIFLCLVLVLSLGTVAFAQEPDGQYSEIPSIGTVSPYEDYAESPKFKVPSLRAYNYTIIAWSNQLIKTSAGTVECRSNTRTNGAADSIRVSYQIQRWNGSSWVYYSGGSSSINNTNNYSGVISKSVSGGYYYRLVTTHYSYKSGVLKSSKTATSSSLYI